jgi:hypothetical protein
MPLPSPGDWTSPFLETTPPENGTNPRACTLKPYDHGYLYLYSVYHRRLACILPELLQSSLKAAPLLLSPIHLSQGIASSHQNISYLLQIVSFRRTIWRLLKSSYSESGALTMLR